MSYRRTLVALAAFATLSSCATTQAPPSDALGAGPALYVARDADSTLYLYGTIHLRRPGEA